MAQTETLTPPINPTEVEGIRFDYGYVLAAGEIIQSAVLFCEVFEGTDPDPASRKIGAYEIGPSPRTDAPSACILQKFGQMIAGVTYRLECYATTSMGQTLCLWTHLACVEPD